LAVQGANFKLMLLMPLKTLGRGAVGVGSQEFNLVLLVVTQAQAQMAS
jgi:hypothetical protein